MLKRILLIIPVFFFFALVTASAASRFTLVVDAGHGGNDFGAPGAVSNEKNLTLKYALAFGRFVESHCPDVRVIYTRKTDVFIPLHERADIANRNKADLFISIHINAVDGSHTAHGFQSYTLGRGERSGDRGIRENLDVAKRENSVIFLEKDYQKKYSGLDMNSAEGDIMFEFIADNNRQRSVELSRLMQHCVCQATGRQDGGSHQNNLAVLRLTSMPAILLELGFISTPDEEQFMNSDSAVDLYTKGIYNAFITYKNKYDTQSTLPYQNRVIEVSAPSNNNTDDDQPVIDDRRSNRTTRTSVQRKSVAGKGSNDTPQQNSNTPQKREVASPKAASKNKAKSDKAVKAEKQVKKDNDKKIVSQQAAHAPVFKIQILQGSYKLRDNDRQFKELTGIERMADGDKWKYFYGSSTDYNAVNRSRKEILDKFPGAFIVAYKDGKQMDVNEAIKEFLSNKRKK
ncbi:MAG: N-acetylmuramoyl-L-alanine amidase [Prevotella sp.]|uniref:N-acetylmuramoyl-L-alanine amidase family protein n=1 Tax=Hallella absiana TaxID=2925336 RepID=UPI0021C60846|nr:N-acetylmuramoyl-L-alanine amidase [Hallella absiana]MDD5821223.1 N-acetylmuramoyl-L-alanine amidase [Prevotella sp.]